MKQKRNKLQRNWRQLPVEEDKFQLYYSDDEQNTALGYDVGEYCNHPMIIAMITDIERSYMYEYNLLIPEGLMYYLIKDRINLQKKELAEKLFEDESQL